MMIMEMRITIALLLISARYSAGQTLYRKVGTEVTLHPGPPAGSKVIRSGEWAFTGASGSLLVLDWDAAGVTVYGRFKDRCELNRTTGVLRIKALTLKDSGVYKAEINNKGAGSTHVSVLSPVPKPTVSGSCDLAFTRCVLTCDGDTTHAEPVTYDWSSGDRASISSLKTLTITQEEPGDDGEFSCVVKNDVSEERSERIANPFKTTTAPVPKPTVYWSCDLAFTLCVLTCDGDTTHAEPVTYDWSAGDRASISSLKTLTITQEEHGDGGEFSCVVKNDVSEESSERIANPFKKTTNDLSCWIGFVVGLVVGVLVLLLVLVLAVAFFLCKCRTGEKPGSIVFTLFGTFIFLGFVHIWRCFCDVCLSGVSLVLLGWLGVPDDPENVVDVDNQVKPKVIDNELNGPQAPAEGKTPENFPLLESPTGGPTGGPSGGPTGEPIRGPDAEDDPGNVDKSLEGERF